eukprot:6075768-Prymnesium_polylepis.1
MDVGIITHFGVVTWCVVMRGTRRGVLVGKLFLEGCPEVPTRCFKPLTGAYWSITSIGNPPFGDAGPDCRENGCTCTGTWPIFCDGFGGKRKPLAGGPER